MFSYKLSIMIDEVNYFWEQKANDVKNQNQNNDLYPIL